MLGAGRADGRERLVDRRAEVAGGLLEVVVHGQRARLRLERRELGLRAPDAERVELGVDRRRRQRLGGREDHQRERLAPERADALARPGHQRAAGRDLRRDVAAEPGGELQQQPVPDAARGVGGEPQRGGRVARAAAHAGGDRDALGDREALGRRVPARRLPEGGERAPGEVGPVDPRADDLVGGRAGGRGLERQLVGQRDRLDDGHERVHAVGARRADEQAEVDLAGREAGEAGHARSLSCSCRHSSGGQRLGARVGGLADRLQRGAQVLARRAAAQRHRAGERLAPVGEALRDERAQLGLRRRMAAIEAHEDGIDVGHGKEHVPRHRADHLHVARELREHGRHSVGRGARGGGEPLADLALDHGHPGRHLGQLLDRAQDDGGGDAVRQVGDDLGGQRLERAQVELDRVGQVERRVGVRVERVAQRRLEPAVQLDHVDVARRLREVLGQHAEAAADLQHDVVRADLRGARDHAEQVRVDQEVLAEVAVRPDPERLHAAQARLRREVAHQPNRRAALASTARSSSS